MSLFLFYNECFMFFIYFCESRVNNNLTYMVKMKRLFLLCAFVSMFATCNFISAQKELGIFNQTISSEFQLIYGHLQNEVLLSAHPEYK